MSPIELFFSTLLAKSQPLLVTLGVGGAVPAVQLATLFAVALVVVVFIGLGFYNTFKKVSLYKQKAKLEKEVAAQTQELDAIEKKLKKVKKAERVSKKEIKELLARKKELEKEPKVDLDASFENMKKQNEEYSASLRESGIAMEKKLAASFAAKFEKIKEDLPSMLAVEILNLTRNELTDYKYSLEDNIKIVQECDAEIVGEWLKALNLKHDEVNTRYKILERCDNFYSSDSEHAVIESIFKKEKNQSKLSVIQEEFSAWQNKMFALHETGKYRPLKKIVSENQVQELASVPDTLKIDSNKLSHVGLACYWHHIELSIRTLKCSDLEGAQEAVEQLRTRYQETTQLLETENEALRKLKKAKP